MDHRAVRLALGLTIAGASMLTAGVATWLITAVGRVTSGAATRDLRLAALGLLGGGGAGGLAGGGGGRRVRAPTPPAGRAGPGPPPRRPPEPPAGLIPGGTEAPPEAPSL